MPFHIKCQLCRPLTSAEQSGAGCNARRRLPTLSLTENLFTRGIVSHCRESFCTVTFFPGAACSSTPPPGEGCLPAMAKRDALVPLTYLKKSARLRQIQGEFNNYNVFEGSLRSFRSRLLRVMPKRAKAVLFRTVRGDALRPTTLTAGSSTIHRRRHIATTSTKGAQKYGAFRFKQ
jgi:hypothetical protein